MFKNRNNYVLFTFITSTCIAALLSLYSFNKEFNYQSKLFTEYAQEKHEDIEEHKLSLDQFLNSINAVIHSHTNKNPLSKVELITAFKAYLDSRNINKEFPGIYGYGLIELVSSNELSAYNQTLESLESSYIFRSLPTFGETNEHWIIWFNQTLGSKTSNGFDLASNPTSQAAIFLARKDTLVSTSKPLILYEKPQADYPLGLMAFKSINLSTQAFYSIYLPHFLQSDFNDEQDSMESQSINLSIYDNHNNCIFTFSKDNASCEPMSEGLVLNKHFWGFNFSYTPSANFYANHQITSVETYVFLSVLFVLLITLYVNKLVKQREELATEVALRTEQIKNEKRNVESTMQATQRFIANVSHELRTPLNGIMGANQILLEDNMTDQQRSWLEISNSSAQHLTNMVNDILDISRLSHGSLELQEKRFKLTAMLQIIADFIELSCKNKNLATDIQIADDIPHWIKGDQQRLKQVLFNILGNAIKFTDQGSISFICNYVQTDENVKQLYIEIKDTGIGIDKAKQKTIFERFNTVDNSNTKRHGGAGLGLSISLELLHLMGGTISLESELGQGSTFKITLPLEIAYRRKTDDITTETQGQFSINGLHIVVLDDVISNIEIAKILLEKQGAQASIFSSPIEAVAYCLEHSDEIDALLCDIQMPEMDGLEVTKKLIANHFDKPIIGLSGNAFSEDVKKALNAGMCDYLTKPLIMSECMRTLSLHVKREDAE
jgi:signal transduction histidine kinase/ActR/RegA family two-component response regulator